MTHLPALLRRAVVATLGAGLALLLTAPAALAHDHLEASSPADHAKLKHVGQLWLEFSAKVLLPAIELDGPDGKAVPLSKPRVQGHKVYARPTQPLTPGPHRIIWRAVASDGDAMHGELTFTITAPPASPTPTPSPTAPATSPTPPPASAQQPSTAAAAARNEGGSGMSGWLWAALVALVAAGAAVLVVRRRKSSG
jgi:methionine-rich copper-binding protein CopC